MGGSLGQVISEDPHLNYSNLLEGRLLLILIFYERTSEKKAVSPLTAYCDFIKGRFAISPPGRPGHFLASSRTSQNLSKSVPQTLIL